jgi:hypothetical protein
MDPQFSRVGLPNSSTPTDNVKAEKIHSPKNLLKKSEGKRMKLKPENCLSHLSVSGAHWANRSRGHACGAEKCTVISFGSYQFLIICCNMNLRVTIVIDFFFPTNSI